MTALFAGMLNQGLYGEMRDMCPTQLIEYKTARQAAPPPECTGGLFDFVFAGNGVFVHAERPELEVCFPIQAAEIRGLPAMLPMFDFRLPRIPESFVGALIRDANLRAEKGLETLFHLCWSGLALMDDGWVGYEPEQARTAGSCRPLAGGGSHERAIVEVHSHHSMAAKFSETDDGDETGFRLYGVVGRLPDKPEIRMRVGVYGYFWEIPATWVMDLPEEIHDTTEIHLNWSEGGTWSNEDNHLIYLSRAQRH